MKKYRGDRREIAGHFSLGETINIRRNRQISRTIALAIATVRRADYFCRTVYGSYKNTSGVYALAFVAQCNEATKAKAATHFVTQSVWY